MYDRVRAAPLVPHDFLYESANNISLQYDVIVVVVSTSDVNKSKQHTSNIPRSINFFLSFDVVFFFFQAKNSNDVHVSYDYAFTVSKKRDLFFFLEYSDVMTSYLNS